MVEVTAVIAGLSEFLQTLVATYGLWGLLLASFLSNATLFFVVPFEFVVFALGVSQFAHPVLLGVVVGLGAALGELVAYVIGRGGEKAMAKVSGKHFELFQKTKRDIETQGMALIFLLALVPFPFDLVGVACGLIRYNVVKFFVPTFLGKTIKFTIVAYAGWFGLEVVKAIFLGA